MRDLRRTIARHLLGNDEQNLNEAKKEREDGDLIIFAFVLILIGIFIGYCYETFPFFKKIEKFFPHSSAMMILGFIVGFILLMIGKLNDAFSFNSEFFFIYLLPPIIFSAGYNLPKDFFFHNFGSIMTFAFVGTTISAFFIGSSLYLFGYIGLMSTSLTFTENMMMGSLISAVDPVAVILVLKTLSVDEQLKVLLFGESVLNDAASVVINRVFVDIEEGGKSTKHALAPAIPQIIGIAIASILIGSALALAVAFVFKHGAMRKKGHSPEIELAAFLLGAFLPYGVAEACGLSGICAVLFAGIMTDYYTFHHLTPKSKISTRHVVSTLSYISECFVFIYLGMSFFLEEGHEFRADYVAMTLFLCFGGRALSVFPLAYLLNMGRKHQLPMKHQIVLWYSGLRGPVAYALAIATPESALFPEANNIIISTTVFIVAFTTLCLGGLSFPFLAWLKPPLMRSTINTKTDTYDISNHWFNRLDRRFLRPYFGPDIRANKRKPSGSGNDLQMDIIQNSNSNDTNEANLMQDHDDDDDKGNTGAYDMHRYVNEPNDDDSDGAAANGDDGDRNENRTQTGIDHIHLSVGNGGNNGGSGMLNNRNKVDYSAPGDAQPSFVDNPQEASADSETWSHPQNSNLNANQNKSMQSLSRLDVISDQLSKAVTPPPNDPNPDIMSSIADD